MKSLSKIASSVHASTTLAVDSLAKKNDRPTVMM